MSLNATQRRVTGEQLRANMDLSGVGIDDLAVRLNLPPDQIRSALAVAPGTDPALVWRLRDVLESAARATGAEPVAYTYLPESMRAAARGWYGVGDGRF